MRPVEAIDRVVAATARHYGMTAGEMLSKSRKKTVATARHVAMYLSRSMVRPGPSYPELAAYFETDHTTVMHAVHRIERQKDEHAGAIKQIRIAIGRDIIGATAVAIGGLRKCSSGAVCT